MNLSRPLSALSLALLLSGPASAALLFDTGTPGNDPNIEPPWTLGIGLQSLAGEFTLGTDTLITGIQGYLHGDSDGELTLSVYSDGGDIPGSRLFSAAFMAQQAYDWYGLNALNWLLNAGSYWAVFEVLPGQSFVSGGMPGGAPNPLGQEAYNTILFGTGWENPGPMGMGMRISGDSAPSQVPEPASLALIGLSALGMIARRRRPTPSDRAE